VRCGGAVVDASRTLADLMIDRFGAPSGHVGAIKTRSDTVAGVSS
jgi:hypothetical protein